MEFFKKALALLLCLSMLFAFAACGDSKDSDEDGDDKESAVSEGDPNCTHTYGDWEVTKERTCILSGSRQRSCTLCGKQEVETLNATGHAYSGDKCETCGKAAIKNCNHKNTDTVLISAATCEENGRENIVCKACKGIVDYNYLYSLGHEYESFDAQEPTCTEDGWYSYSTCKNCDYTSFEARPATGHSYIAGTCTVCASVDEGFEIVTVEQPAENAHTVAKPEANPAEIAKAEITITSGEIKSKNQVDKYTFTATNAGAYRIWITELYSGNVLQLYVKNSLGETVASSWYCENNGGVTVGDAVAGETYTVEVHQYTGTSTYNISIASQKATTDISANTEVKDSIEFVDQENNYTFTPAVDGTYRFEIANMIADTEVEIYVYNRLGETVASSWYCENGGGVTAMGLSSAETYTVTVAHRNLLSDYTLVVGKQSAIIDISAYTKVTDSIRFGDQVNNYTFTVPADGNYRFEVADMTADTEVRIYLLNHLGESVESATYCENGEGITAEGLKAGEKYTVQVCEQYGISDYSLIIGSQKPAVAINSNMAVKDSVKYSDQVNVYNFVADAEGDHQFIVSGMNEDCAVSVYIYDENGETVDYDSYCYNNEGVTVYNVAVGDKLTVEVHSNYGLSDYTLSIQ